MIGTPNNLDVLLHYYVSPSHHPRRNAPAVDHAIDYLMKNDLMAPDASSGEMLFRVTPRGEFYIKHLLAIPFPVDAFRIPE